MRDRVPVNVDHAIVHRALGVVRERGGRHHRREHDVVVLEETLPGDALPLADVGGDDNGSVPAGHGRRPVIIGCAGELGERAVGEPGADERQHDVLPRLHPVRQRHGKRHGLHPGARLRQARGETIQAGTHVGGDRDDIGALGEHRRDPHIPDALDRRTGVEFQPPGPGVARDRARDDLKDHAQIPDAARDRPGDAHVGLEQAAGRTGNVADQRYDAVRRLQPVHAVVMGRVADRAADVAAQLERGESGGDGRRGATRRSANGPAVIPRVVGPSVNVVVGLPVAREQRRVRLAEHDRARRLQPGDGDRVCPRHVPGEFRGAGRGNQALGLEHVLHRHRQSVQRAASIAARGRVIGGLGGVAGAFGVPGDDRVQGRVELGGPFEQVVEQFAAGDLAVLYRPREFGGGGGGEVHNRTITQRNGRLTSRPGR
jgi:hypothetical protein